MMKKFYVAYFYMVMAVIITISVSAIFIPGEKFSQNENRILNSIPKFNFDDFLKGDYQNDLEKGYSDNVIYRDEFNALATDVRQLVGMKDTGGVYIGKKGRYFKKITPDDINQKNYIQNLRYVEYLTDKYGLKTVFMQVPSASVIYGECLPDHAATYDADAMYDVQKTICRRTANVDIRKDLMAQKNKNNLYFRTDHHWTWFGAYEGYKAVAKELGKEVIGSGYFKPEKKSKNFYGTLYSSVLDRSIKPDEMTVPTYSGDYITVNYEGVSNTGKVLNDMFDESAFKKKDKYTYYFGGNYSRADISNNQKKGTLLVFKDSYANSLIPMLASEYERIVMIDLRYYKKSVNELISTLKNPEILIVYEMSEFAKSKDIKKLIY